MDSLVNFLFFALELARDPLLWVVAVALLYFFKSRTWLAFLLAVPAALAFNLFIEKYHLSALARFSPVRGPELYAHLGRIAALIIVMLVIRGLVILLGNKA